jgi:hypothetical protein
MYFVLGFGISIELMAAILAMNTLLVAIAIVGFTNLRNQIRELKETINLLKARQKELHE